MAITAEAERMEGRYGIHKAFAAVMPSTGCLRCGGLLVTEYCMDLFNSTGEIECAASRCVQCGDVVDPVILRNRLVHREPRRPGLNATGMVGCQ
ncbi:MAG: hypothetical protein KF814_16000 [Nitrospiraceae bacterium]|nr:hypothetical protein [Nitrospiraceae bacterium]